VSSNVLAPAETARMRTREGERLSACVRMRVCERTQRKKACVFERECVCVSACVLECERERERESVCV
jgi:hypothetical protein